MSSTLALLMGPSELGIQELTTSVQVSYVHAGPSQEIYSFSFGGSGDSLLAAGCKSKILFWDWRNKKQAACLEESHVDDVTQV